MLCRNTSIFWSAGSQRVRQTCSLAARKQGPHSTRIDARAVNADDAPSMSEELNLWRNTARGRVRNLPLSICGPFYRSDVRGLPKRLIELSDKLRNSVEMIFADDGSRDPATAERLR